MYTLTWSRQSEGVTKILLKIHGISQGGRCSIIRKEGNHLNQLLSSAAAKHCRDLPFLTLTSRHITFSTFVLVSSCEALFGQCAACKHHMLVFSKISPPCFVKDNGCNTIWSLVEVDIMALGFNFTPV